MEIEKLATSAVQMSIAKTDKLSSYINSGDKEPCWDGNIYIHEGKNRTKTNLKKVATQVKGKLVKNKDVKETIHYSISKDDLHAYMMNGGTMFFVVYIDMETGNTLQIYYASLLPFMINSILKEEKKSYKVFFRKFPQDNCEKVELFLNFYSDAIKQASFAGKDIPTIEELTKAGRLESLTIHYTGYKQHLNHNAFPKLIDGKPMTVYANVKGGVAPIPVEYYENILQVMTSNENDTPVSVNGKQYYDGYKVITSAKLVELHIGSCVRVIFPNTDEKDSLVNVSVKIKFKGNLKEQISGMEFVLAMVEHGYFNIGESKLPMKFTAEELEKIEITEIPDILPGYKRAQRVLDSMNVKKELAIESCTDEDIEKLNLLIESIEGRRPLEDNPENFIGLHTVTIANLNLAVAYLKNSKGECQMWDYFGNHLEVECKLDDGTHVRTSQFCMMKADDFLKFDNVDLNFILEDYKSIESNKCLCEHGNETMLEMLKAYDKKTSPNFLQSAKELLEWIKTQPDFIEVDTVTLNELQIVLRERQLTFDEKMKLYTIIGKAEDMFYKIGAFLLLDEQNEAKKLLDNLTKEQLETFKNFPIYKFYKLDDDKAEK